MLDVDYGRTLSLVLYRMPDPQKYRTFEIPRKCGGTRLVHTPRPILMKLQKRLLPYLQSLYAPPPCAHGHVEGRSIRSNAASHTGRRFVVNLDLQDFFPSIHFKRIEKILASARYQLAPAVAVAICQLCCYGGRLPIGAPTSGILSNMVCGPLDSVLMRHAKRHSLHYSRYVDDITFSTSSSAALQSGLGINSGDFIARGVDSFSGEFRQLIEQEGFDINTSKVWICNRRVRQRVTGLVVNKKPNVPIEYFRSLRGAVNAIEKYGLAAAQTRFSERRHPGWSGNLEENLLGRLSYLGQISEFDARYVRIARRVRGLLPSRRVYIPLSERERAVFQITTIIDEDEGTAFHIGRGLFLTAAHVFGEHTEVRTAKIIQPHYSSETSTVTVVRIDFDLDIALVQATVPDRFKDAPAVRLKERTLLPRDEVTALGFPQYNQGNSCSEMPARVTGSRRLAGVDRFEVDRPFPHGASGGPVLDAHAFGVGLVMSGPQLGREDAPMATTFTSYSSFKLTLAEWIEQVK